MNDAAPLSRYNIAPGTWISGFRQTAHDRAPEPLDFWWGYRPKWAKGKAAQPINARGETVATSGYFKVSFQKQRCLIPADGWYEWLTTESGKQPHYITRCDREPLAFAGIYTEREDGSLGCAILTEPARGQAQRGRRKGAKRRDQLLPRVKKMADQGASQREIAEEVGVSQKTVSNWIKRGFSDA